MVRKVSLSVRLCICYLFWQVSAALVDWCSHATLRMFLRLKSGLQEEWQCWRLLVDLNAVLIGLSSLGVMLLRQNSYLF